MLSILNAMLFAATMRALGLSDQLHAYLDQLPASALMISNLISMFGLHRRASEQVHPFRVQAEPQAALCATGARS